MGRIARYVTWVQRRSLWILAASFAVLAASSYLIAFHLPLLADFSYLLPQDATAVRDLRRIEARVRSSDTLLVVIRAPSSAAREAVVSKLDAGIRALPRTLVQNVESDDAELRAFLREHRHLFVPLENLTEARDRMREAIEQAKLDANPLFIDLEDKDPEATSIDDRLAELRARRREAEAKLDRSGHVSADGTIATIDVHVAFRSTDVDKNLELVAALEHLRGQAMAAHAGVQIGFAGAIMTTIVEHAAITRGMLLSSAITALLVGLVLALYLRKLRLLVMLFGTLVVGTTAAFGAAALTVGHLNGATAFLGAIIAGNGVNYGIILLARYLEERGDDRDREHALTRAIAGTLKPTLVASLGAAIAYGSLAATSFRGFADFALMGALGMVLCWLASYTLLPALIVRFGGDASTRSADPWIGALLARVFAVHRPRAVRFVMLAGCIAAGAIVFDYIRDDPFEYDMKRLRSEGEDADTARRWMKLSDDTFGRSMAGPIYIAAERPGQVPHIVRALANRDPEHHIIGPVRSIVDAIPERQPEKLAVLAEIRALIDREIDNLDDELRTEVLELRPPDHIVPITVDKLPPILRDRLIEKDGRVGLLIAVQTAMQPDEWSGHELIQFATAVRRIELPGGDVVTTSGPSVVFADIVATVAHDGPIVTLVAIGCLIVMVLLLVGPNRRGLAVLAATGSGSLFMVATCALLGIKVNFLDFVALPITLGLGVDYAINIAHRDDDNTAFDPTAVLRTSGAAVALCSLTTIIGYGSLLVSDNLAIKGFGLASLIGEITCLVTALVLVPALLMRRSRVMPARRSVRPSS